MQLTGKRGKSSRLKRPNRGLPNRARSACPGHSQLSIAAALTALWGNTLPYSRARGSHSHPELQFLSERAAMPKMPASVLRLEIDREGSHRPTRQIKPTHISAVGSQQSGAWNQQALLAYPYPSLFDRISQSSGSVASYKAQDDCRLNQLSANSPAASVDAAPAGGKSWRVNPAGAQSAFDTGQ